jgi:hypothetical protein
MSDCRTDSEEKFNNNVTYRAISGQRLGKNIPAGANAPNNRMSIAGQSISKHA